MLKAGVEMAGTVTALKGLAEDGQGGTFRIILPAYVMGGAGIHSGPERQKRQAGSLEDSFSPGLGQAEHIFS